MADRTAPPAPPAPRPTLPVLAEARRLAKSQMSAPLAPRLLLTDHSARDAESAAGPRISSAVWTSGVRHISYLDLPSVTGPGPAA